MKRCVKCFRFFEKREIRPEDAGKAFANRYCLKCLAKRPICPVIVEVTIQDRLEALRAELRAERISYGELAELQSLAQYIDKGDVELLEAAGVPEASCE